MATTETVVHSTTDKIAGPTTIYRLRVDDLVYRVCFYSKSGTYVATILEPSK